MSEAEHICFVADQSAPKMLSLPERILQRPDLALVGTGSLSCIRALYLEAARLGKTHQFFPCLQTAESYATGENGAQLGTFLNEVLKTPGLGGILVYASCADILSQTDFESIFQGLDNPRKIPVRALLRFCGRNRRRKRTQRQLPAQIRPRILIRKRTQRQNRTMRPIGPETGTAGML